MAGLLIRIISSNAQGAVLRKEDFGISADAARREIQVPQKLYELLEQNGLENNGVDAFDGLYQFALSYKDLFGWSVEEVKEACRGALRKIGEAFPEYSKVDLDADRPRRVFGAVFNESS